MKKLIKISLALMLALTFACSSDISMEGYSPPKVKTQEQCIFPKAAQEEGIEGSTTVLIQIDNDGNVYKTNITETSGYQILDLAALDYCNQLKFQPARWGDNAIGSRIEMDIDFKYSDRQFNVRRYFFRVEKLYRTIANTDGDTKVKLQKQLLTEHHDFIDNMRGGIDFNRYAEDVMLNSIGNEWRNVWDSYPLTFLLYHDFIQRYPDFPNIAEVKDSLRATLSYDLFVIRNSRVVSKEKLEMREVLLRKIKSFFSKKYPEFDLKSLDKEMKNYTTQASY